jgi:hypothetical protein
MVNPTVLTSGKIGLKETKLNVYPIEPSLERLSKADPANVQEIVASQIELMTVYHNVVLEQAQQSFRWALRFAGIGLIFFMASASFATSTRKSSASIPLISGAIVEVIAGVNFYLYAKTSEQLANFQGRLDKTQSYLLANSICEGLEGDVKQNSRAILVSIIAAGNDDGET